MEKGSSAEEPGGTPLQSSSKWFAIRVKSNFEKVVSLGLRQRGYEELLPVYLGRPKFGPQLRHVERPLFPGYVFARFDVRRRLPVLMTPGVVHIVGLGRVPVPVDDGEIRSLQKIAASGLAAGPWPFLNAGQKIVLDNGPLRGAEGFVVEARENHRLVVSVTLLQRSVSVEIDRDWARPHPATQPLVSRAGMCA